MRRCPFCVRIFEDRTRKGGTDPFVRHLSQCARLQPYTRQMAPAMLNAFFRSGQPGGHHPPSHPGTHPAQGTAPSTRTRTTDK
jgi:hypothetical protein